MENSQPTQPKLARRLKPEGADPIVKIILAGKPSTFVRLLIGVLLVILLPPLWAIKKHNFVNGSLTVDTLHDYGYWNQFLLMLPFMVWFMRHYFAGLESALQALLTRKVIEKSDPESEEFIQRANALFMQRWLRWSPYLLGAAIPVVAFVSFLSASRNTWNSPPNNPLGNLSVWLSLPPVFLLYVVLGHFVGRVACLWGVIRLFMADETKVHINPLHPDGAGGLAPLGDFSFRILPGCIVGGVCTVVGCLVNISQYNLSAWHPTYFLMLGGYILALSVVFILPLYAARGQMKKAIVLMLGRIGNRCNQIVQTAVDDLEKAPDPSKSKAEEVKWQNELMKRRLESIESIQSKRQRGCVLFSAAGYRVE